MKALKPSHREKRRYLVISGKDANQKITEEAILKFLGILGYAKVSPQIVKKAENRAIISIKHTELDRVRAALLMSGKDIKIEKVSGILKKLRQ